MSLHDEQKGLDLHEPSRVRILNSTGAQLNVGQWVFLGVDENSQGFVPVTTLAGSNDKLVGLITDEDIATGTTGTVLTMGRTNIDTSAFSVGNALSLVRSATGNTYSFVASTDPSRDIAIVLTVSAAGVATGTIFVDTISIGLSTSSGGATTLNGLSDVEIASLQAGDILVNDGGIFKNQQPTGDDVVVTGPDAITGEVTITEDGTTHTFDSGHALFTKDGSTPNVGAPGIIPQRQNLVFNGPQVSNETILINGVSTQVTEVSTTTLLPSSDTTTGAVEPFTRRTDNREVVEIFKNSVGTPNEITITDNGSIDNGLLTYSAPELRSDIDSLTGVSGDIANIQNVTIDTTTLRNTDVLEYDISDMAWKNVGVPSSLIERLEDLEDVAITDQLPNKIIISESRAAALDIETIDAANIFGVDVSANLMVISTVSNSAIDQIAFGIARGQAANSINYLVTDTQLLVELNFASATTTRDQIYALAFEAMQTNFSGGQGNNELVIDGNTYIRNGEWSTPTNPRFTPGTIASGSTTYSLLQTSGRTDTSRFIYTFHSGFGSISAEIDIPDRNVDANSLTDIVAEIVVGLNGNSSFATNFTATSSVGTLTITADAPGGLGNAVLHGFMRDSGAGNPSGSTIFSPAAADVTVTGGVNTDDSATILRWIDISHQHEITKPLPFEQAILHFKQGAFAWRDEDFELGNLIDVNPNTETFPQMLVRPQSQTVFNYTDARIENLDVDNQADRLKTGTMLQYTTGNADWAYIGLGDDGTVDANNQPNYTATPADGQFMVYDFRDGFGPQWTAHNAVLNNLFDVTTENESRGAILTRGATEWSAEDATPGEFFAEIGNLSGADFGALPIINPRFDQNYIHTPGEVTVSVPTTGAYEISFGVTKSLTQNSTGNNITETLRVFVSKNSATEVIGHTDYMGRIEGAQLFAQETITIPGSGTGANGPYDQAVTPLIVDLVANDNISLRFQYVLPGVIGIDMENGFYGKSWLKINRLR